MGNILAMAWAGEEALLSAEVRRDPARLGELLASDVYEIGQSGRHWDKSEIVAALSTEASSEHEVVLGERQAQHIASDVVLLTYVLRFDGRVSIRSSLWRQAGDSVQCIFHQGTPVSIDDPDLLIWEEAKLEHEADPRVVRPEEVAAKYL